MVDVKETAFGLDVWLEGNKGHRPDLTIPHRKLEGADYGENDDVVVFADDTMLYDPELFLSNYI